jgi:hypothetical protein
MFGSQDKGNQGIELVPDWSSLGHMAVLYGRGLGKKSLVCLISLVKVS